MSRRLAYLPLVLAAAACAPDATAPTAARQPAPSALYVGTLADFELAYFQYPTATDYQPSALPLESAAAINSSGAIVGMLGGAGVYYSQGVTTTLPLPSNISKVTPVDVIDDGRILTRGNSPQGTKSLLYFSPTAAPIDIAAPYWSEPYAMNNQGEAVGRFGAPGRSWGAFRWTPATGVRDITPPGYDLGWVTHLSESGYAAGWVQLGNDVHEYRWNPGGLPGAVSPSRVVLYQALEGGSILVKHPTLGSATWSLSGAYTATGPEPVNLRVVKISPNGRNVGNFKDAATGQSRVWTSKGLLAGSGTVYVLPVPDGFSNVWVTDVNACGTILGYGDQTADNARRAIVWTRTTSCDISPIVRWPVATTGTLATAW